MDIQIGSLKLNLANPQIDHRHEERAFVLSHSNLALALKLKPESDEVLNLEVGLLEIQLPESVIRQMAEQLPPELVH